VSQRLDDIIVAAASKLLAERGVHGIASFDAVDAAAGLAPGTTRSRCASLADLHRAIWASLVTQEMSLLAESDKLPAKDSQELAGLFAAYVYQTLASRSESIRARTAVSLRPSVLGGLLGATTKLIRQADPGADDDASVRLATTHRALTAIAISTGVKPRHEVAVELFEKAIEGPGDGDWAFTPSPP
jgi:hypothetical protein